MNYYKDGIEEGTTLDEGGRNRNLWRCNPSRFNKDSPRRVRQYPEPGSGRRNINADGGDVL
ncbi:MAG: hypothetical protein ACLR0U_16305 [Enterocloster clostridioformis]